MGLFAFGKKKSKNEDVSQTTANMEDVSIMALGGQFLIDTETDITGSNLIKMPIGSIAALGVGVSSLLPAFQNVAGETGKLYRLANESLGDTLKIAKDGNFWGAFKKADGGSKLVKLQEVQKPEIQKQGISAINPATMLMAVTLFSIDQEIGKILEMEKKIMSFLENEKESQIEADVVALTNSLKEYKFNWDKEVFVQGHYKQSLDIKRNAEKNMRSYQKEISEIIKNEEFIVTSADSTKEELKKKFSYYRMSLYTFSLGSLMELMLLGDFREEHILKIKDEIEEHSLNYRELFSNSEKYIESLADKEIGNNVMKGLGFMSKAIGDFIGSIPLVNEGPIDEWLVESGESLQKSAEASIKDVVKSLGDISNPNTDMFIEKMNDLNNIYNKTTKICVDKENLYLLIS